MDSIKLSESESRMMNVIWDRGQVPAARLAEICEDLYSWKRPTVYTMIGRMEKKGYLVFESKIVKPLIQREQVNRSEGAQLLHKGFGDSLPDLFASFLRDRKLTKDEATRLQKMIEEATEK